MSTAGSKNSNVRMAPASPRGGFRAITEDANHTIWALTPHHELFRVKDQTAYLVISVSSDNRPTGYLAPDHKGGLWIGSLNGTLTYYRDGQTSTISIPAQGSEFTLMDLAVDSDDSLLLSTSEGLFRWDNQHWQVLNHRNGIPEGAVFTAIRDDVGALWLYAQRGLVRITKAEYDRWLGHSDRKLQTEVFDKFDGLRPRLTFLPLQPMSTKTRDGKLWFAASDVLQMIDPTQTYRNGIAPPVRIERVIADHKDYPVAEMLHLPALTRDVEIDYTALSFAAPQKVQFRYMLLGHDSDWQDAATRRRAFYNNLRPGKYRFRVIACNNSGVWNEQGASLDFAIAPAFYQTVWFRSLGVILFLGVLTGLYRLRVRHLERQRDALRKSEKELRDVIDTIPATVWSALPDGSNTYANKRFVEYLGLSAEQTAGSGWQAAIHPDDLERHAGKWMEAVATGKPHENEARFHRSDGQYRWHLDRGVPLRDEDGNIVKWYGVATDIEDRKRAEEALGGLSRDLQESKAKLEEAQRVSHVGYWEWDLLTDRVNWSDETYRIYGLRPQEYPIDIAVVRKLIHPEDLELVFRVAEDAVRGGLRTDVEHRIVRPSGEPRIVHSQGDVKRDTSGRPTLMFGTVQDITDRKRAEEALQQSQFYLAEGQRLAHMGSWAFNPSGFFEYWSQELFEIYGLDPQKGAPTLEQYLATVHPQDREFMADTIKRMQAERGGCDVKKRIVRPDGEQRYIRCVGIPVVEGEVLKGFLGTAMDITEQELLTRELELRQAHLAEAQKLTHTSSWVWRVPDRNAVQLSEEWYRIYGFDPAEGPPVWEKRLERVHPEDRLKWKGTIERAIVEKADYDVVFRILLPHGMVKWIHTVGHPVLSRRRGLEIRRQLDRHHGTQICRARA